MSEGLLGARLCAKGLKNIQVHSHKVYGIWGVCYDPHVSERETEARGSCNAIFSRSWNLQRAAQGWNPYLSALRFLSITHFSTGLGYFATKYLGDYLEPVLWSPLLPGSHPHLVEWSWFTLLRRQASYPSTEAGGSRRPELAERLNLGIFLLHEISFRTFGPLGLPHIANC